MMTKRLRARGGMEKKKERDSVKVRDIVMKAFKVKIVHEAQCEVSRKMRKRLREREEEWKRKEEERGSVNIIRSEDVVMK